jgi:hypothetical protein
MTVDELKANSWTEPVSIERVGYDAYLFVLDTDNGEIGFALSTAGLVRTARMASECVDRNVGAILDDAGALLGAC